MDAVGNNKGGGRRHEHSRCRGNKENDLQKCGLHLTLFEAEKWKGGGSELGMMAALLFEVKD